MLMRLSNIEYIHFAPGSDLIDTEVNVRLTFMETALILGVLRRD
jgi:hypothetical protein